MAAQVADCAVSHARTQGKQSDRYTVGRNGDGSSKDARQHAGLHAAKRHDAPGHSVESHDPSPHSVRDQDLQGTLDGNHVNRVGYTHDEHQGDGQFQRADVL